MHPLPARFPNQGAILLWAALLMAPVMACAGELSKEQLKTWQIYVLAEQCRMWEPGFAARSDAAYHQWLARNGAFINELQKNPGYREEFKNLMEEEGKNKYGHIFCTHELIALLEK